MLRKPVQQQQGFTAASLGDMHPQPGQLHESMLDAIEIRKPGLLGHELDPATPSSEAKYGLRDVLGLVRWHRAHDLLGAEPVDHRQQPPRRDVDVGHPEFAVGDARPHDVGDAVQPLGGQLLGLGRQRCVAPPQAPRLQP